MTLWKWPVSVKLSTAIFLVACSAGEAVAQNPPLLRYGYQAGQRHAYDVKIHAVLPDCEEDFVGMLTWNVKSANEQQVVLQESGMLARSVKNTSGMIGPPGFGGPPMYFPGFGVPKGVTIDRQGKVILVGELKYLPLLLGAEDTLVFEDLAPQAQTTWDKQRDLVIEEKQRSMFPFPGGPFGRNGNSTQLTSREQSNFAIAEVKGETVRVTKRYSLRSEEAGQPAKFNMTGEGQFVFNTRQGIVESLSMKYEIQVNKGNVTTKIPITVSYQVLSPDELAQREKQAQEARRKAEEDAKPKPFRPGEREKLLADLAAADEHTVQAAADRLVKIVRDDQAAEVAKALAPLLTHSNDWVKGAAAKALAVWATPDVESPLIEASKSSNIWVRAATIGALGHVKTEAAAQAVGAQMHSNRGEAAKALKAMGPVAEGAAIAALKNSNDGWVNKDVLGVLAEIGGEDALEAIQELLPRFSWLEKGDADKAMDAIKGRLRASPQTAKRSAKPTAAAVLRKWHDVTGSFEVEATYVSMPDNTVRLRRKDGRTLNVPLEKLSEEDRAYVAEQAKKPKPSNPFE
jgi:hypothetical protein